MGFLPSPDTDLTELSKEELESLKTLLESEMAMAKARVSNCQALLSAVVTRLGEI